ncbi:MAG: DUF6868 family protein [Thermodesulfobacteriota bacterium]
MYQLHANWFRLSVERSDTIHYAGLAGYKITVLVFNLVPYLALHIVSWPAGFHQGLGCEEC